MSSDLSTPRLNRFMILTPMWCARENKVRRRKHQLVSYGTGE